MPVDTRQRLDKWLWFGRFVKTRVLAAELVAAGHVRINRTRVVKPGHDVKAGDVLTVAIHGRVRVVRVSGLAERRGSPEMARNALRRAGDGGRACRGGAKYGCIRRVKLLDNPSL